MKHVVTDRQMRIIKECLGFRSRSARKVGASLLAFKNDDSKYQLAEVEDLVGQIDGFVHQKNLFDVVQPSKVEEKTASGIEDERRLSIVRLFLKVCNPGYGGNDSDLFKYMESRVAAKDPNVLKKTIVQGLIEEFLAATGKTALIATNLTSFLGGK